MLMRALLDELGLKAWLKTSGGKGLHVVVPLAPKLDYEAVKTFVCVWPWQLELSRKRVRP